LAVLDTSPAGTSYTNRDIQYAIVKHHRGLAVRWRCWTLMLQTLLQACSLRTVLCSRMSVTFITTSKVFTPASHYWRLSTAQRN